MNVSLYPHQKSALEKMHNGCILVGQVGSGKSRTAIAYYISKVKSIPIYVITTAKKRDSKEWEDEFKPFGLTNYIIDSWNNIKKYTTVENSFFIFDEQRLVGCGAWVKAFYKIVKKNQWILLTATPGDTWMDYIPVFVANGYFKNKTDFIRRHVIYKSYMKFPVVDRYVDAGKLIRYRREVLVNMDFKKEAVKVPYRIMTDYSKNLYKRIFKDRWDIYDDCPIQETGKLCYLLRKVTNTDPSRIDAVIEILKEHPTAIIFYNFTYELHILRRIANDLGYQIGEWNGEVHSDVPTGDKWVYLVQYTAGSEGWNCITTNVTIFYSQSYSYRTMVQAAGRIDRMNTPFKELYYYYILSSSPIDLAIRRALTQKKNFNEKAFLMK